jgi:hypothetical protein
MVVLWCLMPLSTIFHLYHRHFKIYNIGEILLKVALNTIKQPFQNLWYRWNIVESGIKHHKTTQYFIYIVDFGMVVLWCLMSLSTIFHLYHRFWNGCFMVFNATFNNISSISYTIKQPFQNLWYRWNIVESGIKHHKTTIPKSMI